MIILLYKKSSFLSLSLKTQREKRERETDRQTDRD